MRSIEILLLVAIATLAACEETDTAAKSGSIPAPLGVASAYDAAGRVEIDKVAPRNWEDLHNFFRISENILTAGEPFGEAALRRLSELGVKTILCVDGKAPDAKTAARLGMTCVHVPIEYGGITADEMLRIAKTFREKQGPFFVHCYHGKHRGPAAAAVGRVLMDGVSREVAIAEMRRSGTAKKYEGLYRSIANGELPTEEQTRALKWDFPSAHEISDFRAGMVAMTRHYDSLKLLARNRFEPDAEHPDLDAGNEADKLLGMLKQTAKLKDGDSQPEAWRALMSASVEAARTLRDKIASGDKDAAGALKCVALVKKSCTACHVEFRN